MTILASDCVQRLGWVLIHSVWQDGLVALVFALVLAALRNQSSNLRYLVAYAGLLLMLALPLATYGVVNLPLPQGNAALPAVESFQSLEANRNRQDLPGSTQRLWDSPTQTVAQSTRWLQDVLSPGMPWLTAVWFAGAMLLSLWHLGGWFTVQRLKRSGVSGEIELLGRHLESLSKRMRVARPVRLLRSAVVEVPVVVGWLKPVILLPASMLTGLPPSQLAAVLAHELAHVRRHDYVFNLLQTVIETLLFYHPAAWWISRRIRIEREQCCDDLAVAAGIDRIEYAAALAALEQARFGPALAMAAGGSRREGSTLRRVRRLLARPSGNHVGSRLWLGGALTIVLVMSFTAAAMIGFAAGSAQAQTPAFGGCGGGYTPGGAPDHLLRLLSFEEVRQDLSFEDEKEERIQKLLREFTDSRAEILSRPREPNAEKSRAGMMRRLSQIQVVCDKATKQIESLLTADQQRRLQQIGIQILGAEALFKPEIAKALDITPDQEKRLKAIQEQASQDSAAGWRQNRHESPSATAQRTTEIHYKAGQRMLEDVLTESQKTKLNELCGKKLDLVKYYKPGCGGSRMTIIRGPAGSQAARGQ